jgi:hypothetical protein
MGTLPAQIPRSTDAMAYRKKKALPMKPNCTVLMPSSGIACWATRPRTALSANAMIWKRTSMTVISHARRFIRPV